MQLTILQDALLADRPYRLLVRIQSLTAQERYFALIAYGAPQHIAEAVAHKLITIRTPLGVYRKG